MNKTLILVLAVCLVSVHAFVKRDAPEAPKNDNIMETLSSQGQDIIKSLQEGLNNAFNPEQAKKTLDELGKTITKAFEDLKSKETPKA